MFFTCESIFLQQKKICQHFFLLVFLAEFFCLRRFFYFRVSLLMFLGCFARIFLSYNLLTRGMILKKVPKKYWPSFWKIFDDAWFVFQQSFATERSLACIFSHWKSLQSLFFVVVNNTNPDFNQQGAS